MNNPGGHKIVKEDLNKSVDTDEVELDKKSQVRLYFDDQTYIHVSDIRTRDVRRSGKS